MIITLLIHASTETNRSLILAPPQTPQKSVFSTPSQMLLPASVPKVRGCSKSMGLFWTRAAKLVDLRSTPSPPLILKIVDNQGILKRLPKRMRFFSDWLCWFLVTWTLYRCNYGIMALTSQAQGIYKAYEGDTMDVRDSRLSISRFSRYQVHVDPEKLTSWKGDVTWRLLFEIPLFWSSIPNLMGWFNTTLSTALPQRFQQVAFQKAKASKRLLECLDIYVLPESAK